MCELLRAKNTDSAEALVALVCAELLALPVTVGVYVLWGPVLVTHIRLAPKALATVVGLSWRPGQQDSPHLKQSDWLRNGHVTLAKI